MKKYQPIIETTVLVIAFIGLLLFMNGCAGMFKPSGNAPLVNANSNGMSGNESNITTNNSTGTINNILSSFKVVDMGSITVTATMMPKAINVDKGAVQLIVKTEVPITINGSIVQSIIIGILVFIIIIVFGVIGWARFKK